MTQITNLAETSSPLPWHSQQWQRLVQQLDQGTLPHAMLLAGAAHTGMSQLALALSRLLLCSRPEEGVNCGQCHACELSRSGGHGDFLWVEPQEKSRVIKIDQVREVVQFTNKTSGFGARKVVVLEPADSMNVNASNALLKSLEEPSPDTYLLLICHRMHNVSATIRSRCQICRMPTPDREDGLVWLDRVTGQRETSESLLSLAEGRPLLAQQLYLDDSADQLRARRVAFTALLQGSISASEAASLWGDLDTEELLEQLLTELQVTMRGLSRQQLSSEYARAAFELLDEISALRRAVSAGSNPGKQLILDALMSKLSRRLGAGLHGDNI